MEVYQRVRNIREDNDKTQSDIATLLKTTQHQYSKYERNVQEIPVRHIITLANYYGVSTDYMLGLTDDPTPQKRSNGAMRNETTLHSPVKDSI